MGRRVYDAATVVLVSILRCGATPVRLDRLRKLTGVRAATVHRWRDRYKKLVHEEVIRTVADPSEIEEELRRFFSVLQY